MRELHPTPNRRLLVIDDNLAIHEDFRKIFQPRSHRQDELTQSEAALFEMAAPVSFKPEFLLDTAAQGQEGLALVQRACAEGRPYAVAFVDMRMPPGWDGVETLARLWEADPDLQAVICTAYSDYSLDEILRELGHTDRLVILKKPFDSIEVLQLAHALTAKWELLQRAMVKAAELERRVAERTSELQVTNKKLVAEIAERIQAEDNLRQSQKMDAIGQLAGGVAHDFNNMLTVIRGYAQCLLADDSLLPTVRGSLQQIDGAAERAANLTRQLLAFSRKQVLQPELLNLKEVISLVTKMFHRILGEDIALQIENAPGGAGVLADRAMIEQVLLNLVVNARDAMPRGGQLRVRLADVDLAPETVAGHALARPGKFVCLSVTDTGCGIPAEVLPRIFEPFFTTKEVGKGTGLGLATVYGIVKQHEGWIEVQSALNQGTTFHLFFPASATPLKIAAPAGPAAVVSGGKETILLVEDETALRRMTRSVLQHYGYRVIPAASGAEALKLWPAHAADIDLLFTDMVLPDGLSGHDLAQRLQGEKTGLKVIFCSGYSLEVADRDSLLQASDNFLPKPYTPEKLAGLVRGCLDGQVRSARFA